MTECSTFICLTECQGYVKYIYLANTPNGSISSPNYPSSYGRSQDCSWRLYAPQGQKVLIYFTFLDLENCCSCDYVQVFNGLNSYNGLLTKACNGSFPPPVYSSGRYLHVKFKSDISVEGRGFVAHYKVLSVVSGEKHLVKIVNISSGCLYKGRREG